MKLRLLVPFVSLLVAIPALPQSAVSKMAAAAPTAVPPLVPYSGVVFSGDGKQLGGEVTATFLIFKAENGGEPLFVETQTMAIDAAGRYTVHLGASNAYGLPADLFSTGEARWLEVQIAGQPQQPRVLLASVPYALKAADAATLGGLPASAFALAGGNTGFRNATPGAISPDATLTVTTTGGAAGYVPKFSGAASVVNSPLFVNGSSVGVGTTTPTATLDVNGSGLFT